MASCEKRGASHRKNSGHVTPNLGTAERSPAPKCLRASTRFGCVVLALDGFLIVRALTFVNGKVPLGAPGVNMLNRKFFE